MDLSRYKSDQNTSITIADNERTANSAFSRNDFGHPRKSRRTTTDEACCRNELAHRETGHLGCTHIPPTIRQEKPNTECCIRM